MDENWIRGAWYSAGEQVSVKMIRDKFTGYVRMSNHISTYILHCTSLLQLFTKPTFDAVTVRFTHKSLLSFFGSL